MSKFLPSHVPFVVVAVIIMLLATCYGDLCPDHKISCRKGQTCCAQKSGYGCCPYENATCCTDGLHCCPEDTQCDLPAGRCRRNSVTINQIKLVAPSVFYNNPENIADNELETADRANNFQNATQNVKKQCPDQKSSCPESYTCCADPSGSFACCPFSNGTCCADKIHCCPQGRKCNDYKCE